MTNLLSNSIPELNSKRKFSVVLCESERLEWSENLGSLSKGNDISTSTFKIFESSTYETITTAIITSSDHT